MKQLLPLTLLLLLLSHPTSAQQKKEQTGFDVTRNLEVFADIYRQLDMFYARTSSRSFSSWLFGAVMSNGILP